MPARRKQSASKSNPEFDKAEPRGAEIVTADETEVVRQLDAWGAQRGVKVRLAYDGMEIRVR